MLLIRSATQSVDFCVLWSCGSAMFSVLATDYRSTLRIFIHHFAQLMVYHNGFKIYTVSGKQETEMFSVISFTKLRRFWWNLVYNFLNKFAAKTCKHSPPHLNTLPWETYNAYLARATIEWLKKETPEFTHLNCSLQSRQILTQLITECGDTAREGVRRSADELKQRLRAEWAGLDQVVIAATVISSIVDGFRSVMLMHVLCPFSCSISHTLWSTGFTSGEFGGHSLSGTNSRVFFL